MLKLSLCGHSDAYILADVTITIKVAPDDISAGDADWRNKEVLSNN